MVGLLFSFVSFADEHIATAKIDTGVVQIGDHIKLTLSLKTNKKNTVIFPVLSDTMDSKIEFISVSNLDTSMSEEHQKIYSKTFTITIFEPGVYTFPAIPFFVKKPSDKDFSEVPTNTLTITVAAPKVDVEKDIKDIKTVWKIPITFKEILPYLLMILGAGIVLWASIYVYRKWKNKEPIFVFAPKPVIPAHIEALEKLEALRLKQLWQNNLVKEYYTELTDILRIYIEKGLLLNAVEMTSDELIETVSASELSHKSELLTLLQDVLPTADLVKFAKLTPLADEHDRCFKNVKQFVEATIPQKEEGHHD